MQISGEPFAQLLGRDLAGYDRFNRTPDLYFDPDDRPPAGRPARLLDGDRVVRVLEAADEQHVVRVGRRACRCSTGRCSIPNQVAGDAGGRALARSHPDVRAAVERRRRARHQLRRLAGARRTIRSTSTAGPATGRRSPSSRASIPTITPATDGNRLLLQLHRRLRRLGRRRAAHRRLRVLLQLAQPAEPRRAGRQGARARRARLRDLEAGRCGRSTTGRRCTTPAGNPITVVADADMPQVGVHGNGVVGKYPDPNDPTGRRSSTACPASIWATSSSKASRA